MFEVKATGGDSALGGDDIDRAIALGVVGEALTGDDPTVRAGSRRR